MDFELKKSILRKIQKWLVRMFGANEFIFFKSNSPVWKNWNVKFESITYRRVYKENCFTEKSLIPTIIVHIERKLLIDLQINEKKVKTIVIIRAFKNAADSIFFSFYYICVNCYSENIKSIAVVNEHFFLHIYVF